MESCKMLNIILLRALFVCAFLFGSSTGKGVVGPGIWSVIHIQKCPEADSMPIEVDVKKYKLNRTTDVFDAKMKLNEVLDESFAVRIDVCQLVDGGCKPYQLLSDDSIVKFVEKYAEDNVRRAMTMAKVDPPEFPMSDGEYEIEKYIMNYNELPKDGPYGTYGAKAYLVKDAMEKACIECRVLFEDEEEDAEDE